MKPFVCLNFLLFALLQSANSQDERIKSIASLPATVKPPSGVLSLIADYDHASKGTVRLYLVNRTGGPITVPTEDGDFYAKRETPDASGKWQRCDTHVWSGCGNSYGSAQIPSDSYYRRDQELNSERGTLRKVRFRMHQALFPNLISNEGTAVIDDEDIASCKMDGLAIAEDATLDQLVDIGLGKLTSNVPRNDDGVESAMRGLKRFKNDPRLLDEIRRLLLHHRTVMAPFREERFGRIQPSQLRYVAALAALPAIIDESGANKQAWELIRSEFLEPTNPWRREALFELDHTPQTDRPYRFAELVFPILKEIILSGNEPGVDLAISILERYSTKPEAASLLRKVLAEKQRPEHQKIAAKDAFERLYPNPFLSVSVTLPKPSESEDVWGPLIAAPAETIRIKNISPQAVKLHSPRPEDLLVFRITGANGIDLPLKKQNPKEKATEVVTTIEAGQSFEFHQVKWWECIDPSAMIEGTTVRISVYADTPGLWPIPGGADPLSVGPGEGGNSWEVKTEGLLEKIRSSQGQR